MYYLARVKVATDNGKKVTWKKEAYLVNAVSVTDAEAIVNKDFADDMVEFEVVEVKKSDVIVHLSGINRHNDEKFIFGEQE